MSLNDSLEKLDQLTKQRDEKHFDFQKHLLIMASSLLGILIALYSKENRNIAFSMGVCGLSLGILLGSIALFAQIHSSKLLVKLMAEAIREQLKTNSETYSPFVLNPSKWFYRMELMSYVSFGIALVSLSIYVIL